jgi:hypothetical protein
MTTSQPVVDSYCKTYFKIINRPGDGRIAAKPEVKQRILANEQTFRRLCGG